MGLFRSPDRVRLTNEDPVPGFLGHKILAGPGINIGIRTDGGMGHQAILMAANNVAGSHGNVYEVTTSGLIPNDAALVLLNSAIRPLDVVLPTPPRYPAG